MPDVSRRSRSLKCDNDPSTTAASSRRWLAENGILSGVCVGGEQRDGCGAEHKAQNGRETAPVMEVRSLAAYESAAAGGGR
jgi:hypothetical protein